MKYLNYILFSFILASCGQEGDLDFAGEADFKVPEQPNPEAEVLVTEQWLNQNQKVKDQKLKLLEGFNASEYQFSVKTIEKSEREQLEVNMDAPISKIEFQNVRGQCEEDKDYKFVEKNKVLIAQDCLGTIKLTLTQVTLSLDQYRIKSFSQGAKAIKLKEINSSLNEKSFYEDLVASIRDWGIGVKGGTPVPKQINHDNKRDETEVLYIRLPALYPVTNASISVSRLFKNEEGGEQGVASFLGADNNVIYSQVLNIESVNYESSQHQASISLPLPGDEISGLAFYALPYLSGEKKNDSSDYFVKGISLTF